MSPPQVLVPLDGSPLAEDALDHALETFDGQITVLNVVTPMESPMIEGQNLGSDQDRIDRATERASDRIAAARERTGASDRAIQTRIETGDPAEKILDAIDSEAIDHVVMGSHGRPRGELRRRLLGTVSTAVLGEATIPVTVVR